MGWQDVAPSDEVEAADWIHGRLHTFAQDVGSVVPTGFAAYARIFHPASQPPGDADRRPVEVVGLAAMKALAKFSRRVRGSATGPF